MRESHCPPGAVGLNSVRPPLLTRLECGGQEETDVGESTGLPGWLRGKGSACQCRRRQLDPWVGEESGSPLLENPKDRGALWTTVHKVIRVRRDLVTERQCVCVYFLYEYV